jgi:hypothetical protein
MSTRVGTSHFRSIADAVAYYARQSGSHVSEKDIRAKISSGEIIVGPPALKAGQTFELDEKEGRYFIAETQKWRVVYETRKRGAIGEFDSTIREVEADSSQDATSKAFDMLQAEGLETRSPLGAKRFGDE